MKQEQCENPRSKESGIGINENTKYIMYWTSEEILSIFMQQVIGSPSLDSLFPLPPSSTMIIEFWETNITIEEGDFEIRVYLND